MKNKYGAPLDGAGYAPSILQQPDYKECWMCGKNGSSDKLDRHEIFEGPFRKKSKNLGLWVYLCHNSCHIFGVDAVHRNAKNMDCLHRIGQIVAMSYYGWSTNDFIREFGRNYL